MLRSRPVILKNVDAISKFHEFVFSDPAARLSHLIALKIDVAHNETHPEGSARAIDCLVAILKCAASLVSLELHSSANKRPLGYLDNARLAAAVGELATLRELTICGRTEAVNFIAAVRSPLTKLAIRFMHPVGGTEWSPASLSAALSVMANSLERLTMIYSPVRLVPAGISADSLSPFAGAQFHALRSLTLRCPAGVLHLPLLVDLFPNLSGTLHIPGYPDADEYDGPEVSWSPYDSFNVTRERNGRAQEQPGGRSWKRLERLVCEAETLFILNLRCQIGSITVHSCSADVDARRYLVESLRAHPPARLNLQVVFSLGDEPEEPVIGRVPPEAAAVLTHLTLCVNYRYEAPSDYPAVPWDDLWRETLLPALLDLPALTHLRFVFYCDAWMDPRSEPQPGGGPGFISEDAFLNAVRPASFDFAAAVRSIVSAIPSLRYCFLTTAGRVAEMKSVAVFSVAEQWRESRAWRIATRSSDTGGTTRTRRDGESEPEIAKLHEDVAETIMAKEDLGLSTEEQEAMHWL